MKKNGDGRQPYVSFIRYHGGTEKCYIQYMASLPSKWTDTMNRLPSFVDLSSWEGEDKAER